MAWGQFLSKGVSVSRKGSVWGVGGSVQGVSVRGSLFRGISVQGVSVQGVQVQRVSVQGVLCLSREASLSVQGGPCPGGLCQGDPPPPYGYMQAVRILLECILVRQ